MPNPLGPTMYAGSNTEYCYTLDVSAVSRGGNSSK